MSRIYKPCPYCFHEITIKPILEKHQGRYSILCPYCLSHRSEWVVTIENAIESWNTYIRDECKNMSDMKNERKEREDDLFPPRYGTY